MSKHLIDRPYHVRFAATGPHARTGGGWVVAEDPVLTKSLEVVTVYHVRVDEQYADDDGLYILLGDGEILEREEPVDWTNE